MFGVDSDELQLLTFLAGGGAIAPEEASDMSPLLSCPALDYLFRLLARYNNIRRASLFICYDQHCIVEHFLPAAAFAVLKAEGECHFRALDDVLVVTGFRKVLLTEKSLQLPTSKLG